jgi:hypothetical protein
MKHVKWDAREKRARADRLPDYLDLRRRLDSRIALQLPTEAHDYTLLGSEYGFA